MNVDPAPPSAETAVVTPAEIADPPLNPPGGVLPSAAPPSVGTLCPVCRKDDQVTRISGFVDAATQLTTGSARTLGAGVLAGGGAVGGAVTRTNSVTESVLVRRLSPPPQPKGRGCLVAFLVVPGALLGLLGIQAASSSVGSPLLAFVFCALTAAWFYGLWRLIVAPIERRRARWRRRLEELRSGYYCARDDVAFEYGNPVPCSPDAFVRMVFQRQDQDTTTG